MIWQSDPLVDMANWTEPGWLVLIMWWYIFLLIVIIGNWCFNFEIIHTFTLSLSLFFTHSRNSVNEITVVVWRSGPSAKPNFEGLIHRPSYKPSASNYDAPSPPTRRRVPDIGTSKTPPAVPPLPAHHRTTAARRLLVNGSEIGNSSGIGVGAMAWGAQGGSAEELDGKPRHLHHPHTATLKGTRVKASNGDNYIILAPFNPGSQVQQAGGGLHHLHLLRPPHPHHGHMVSHPRYVSLPFIPGAQQ